MENKLLLTFDLEEFDLPLEFGCPISDQDQINVTNNGMERLTGLLEKHNIPATFFTTAYYAEKNKELTKSLSLTHEIASHSNQHSGFKQTDLIVSKLKIEGITGKQVYGFRMPRFQKVDMAMIKAAGYRYDSSVNPTFIPGRYNNLFTRRKMYLDTDSNLIEIPVSVSPFTRFPLFWLSFKNISLPIYLHMCKMVIWKDSYLHLCFHPWEFDDLDSFDIPRYIKNISGKIYSERFEKMVERLLELADFCTISDFLDSLPSSC